MPNAVRHAVTRSTGATTWTRKAGEEWMTTCLNHGSETTAKARGAAWKNGSTPANFCAKCKQIAAGKLEKITGDRLPIPAAKPTRKAAAKPKPKPTAKATPGQEGCGQVSDYNTWYLAGWRAAQRSTDLSAAEERFIAKTGQPWSGAAHDAFEDGWLDWAAGRERFHLRDCFGHNESCGPKPYPDPWGPGGKFVASGLTPVPPEDDPHAELFADCKTAEDVLQLQREIDAAEGNA